MITVANDVLASDQTNEDIIVVYHGNKVLTAGQIDQILHAAGGSDRGDVTAARDLVDSNIFGSFQI